MALPAAIDEEEAKRIVDDAIRRYIAARHAKVDGFVDRHFTVRGAWRINRRALGADVLRAPYNLAAAGPQVSAMAIAKGARAFGARGFAAWLDRRQFFVRTDVAREVEWLLYTELLELPVVDGKRVSTHDALAGEIFADPAVASLVGRALDLLGERRNDPAFEGRLTERLERYTGSRLAAADMATGLMSLAAGGILFKQMTPGMISMGPLVAAVITQHAAISAFPLGSMIGSLWYGMFPAAGSAALLVGVTGGLIAAAAAVSAFSGVLTDPILRRVGLHRRRLHRLLDVLESDMLGRGDARFVIRDHYVARLFDAVDLLRGAARLAS